MIKYALGIDIGTTAVKAVLISNGHKMVCERSAPHDLVSKHPGWAEEDPKDWWHNTLQVIREILEAYPEASKSIEIIGVSGMVPAIVVLDSDGNALRHSIQQNDARAIKEIDSLKSVINQEELFRQTGGFTNQQHVLPRLLWIKNNEPHIWEKAATVFGSYDYINYKLTGNQTIEINWAVESGLFDIRQKMWLLEQLNSFGIEPSLFPDVKESTEIIGTINDEASKLTGLMKGIPVIAGSADHVASTLAAGIVEEGDMLIKFGGAGDILYCTSDIQTNEQLFFDYHIVPDHYLMNGCMASSGSLVKWFLKEFNVDLGSDTLKKLDSEAERVRPGSEGLIVLPYFIGEKTPLFDPKARGVFFGLTLSHQRQHMFRAILESVIYGFKHHVEVIEEDGYKPKRIFATNGGAKSRFWCQIAADVLKQKITSYPSHPGSALGVAYTAGMASGMFSEWSHIARFLTDYKTYTPQQYEASIYDKAYPIYQDLYRQLKSSFDRVSQLYE